MASPDHSGFRRKCRIAFRRFRLCLWLVIFTLLAALLYLNQVGLPGFVKRPLLARLRERGLSVQFTRLRWRWSRGIVAENVRFGHAGDPASPQLTLKEMAVRFNYRALARLQLQVDGLILRHGRFNWALPDTNAPDRELVVTNIQTRLRFLPGDVWQLDHFQAMVAGAQFQFAAAVTNASAISEWSVFQVPARAPPAELQQRLRRITDTLNRLHFSTPAQLRVEVRGDARNWRSFFLSAKLSAPDADTPWGTLRRGSFAAQVTPAASHEPSHAELRLEADSAHSSWVTTTNLTCTLYLLASAPDTNQIHAELHLEARRTETKWGTAGATSLTARWLEPLTNPVPVFGQGGLRLMEVETRWGGARQLQLNVAVSPATNAPAAADTSWTWWTNLAPYSLNWDGRLAGLKSSRLEIDALFCRGRWRAPELEVSQVSARPYGGGLDGQARLSAATRRLSFSSSSDFDPQKMSPLLGPDARHWLSGFSWETPPELQTTGALVLPAWTNREPDWTTEVLPTVALAGSIHLGQSTFRGLSATSTDFHFTRSNQVWRLPDLVLQRPEGRLELAGVADERTHRFEARVRSSVEADAIRPLLGPREERALDLLDFTQPPLVEGQVGGRWDEPQSLGIDGQVAFTNFTFRDEAADAFQTQVEYTNRLLRMIEPRLQRERGTQRLAASHIDVDLVANRVYLTNGVSTADPLAVARAIGPHIGHGLEPFHFLQPPDVHVEGVIPMHGLEGADLHFEVRGGPFAWWKFNVPHIAGKVDWVNERLTLNDLQTDFYEGTATGRVQVVFHPGEPSECAFSTRFRNADFHLLMGDLSEKTNKLEGRLSGRLDITRGDFDDWRSWHGRCRVNLRDGLIWQIPLFGILSPVLDGISPGLGSSRAREGTASFVLTNGVLYSDDLEIKASMMRLDYRGTIDLKGRVNARAQAELLRDTWVIGRVLSLALWPVSKLFEYEITGTLTEPKSEPVYFLPKVMLLPFQAFRAMKEPLPETSFSTSTNAPPAAPPEGVGPDK